MVDKHTYSRGFKTCLYQFVQHEPRLRRYIAEKAWGDEWMLVEMWANGASDHLYDLITGGRLPKWARMAARFLQDDVINCGHGFNRRWTIAEVEQMLVDAKRLLDIKGTPSSLEEAMNFDRSIGLKPDAGYACQDVR